MKVLYGDGGGGERTLEALFTFNITINFYF